MGLLALASTLWMGACGLGPCETWAERHMQCSHGQDRSEAARSGLVGLCEGGRGDLRPQIVCAEDHDDCKGYDRCKTLARGRLAIVQIREKADEGDFERASTICGSHRSVEADLPELASVCEKLHRRALLALTERLRKVRDGGSGEDDFYACVELKKYAAKVSEDAAKAARLLCREAKTSGDAADAIAHSRANLSAGRPDLPSECRVAIAGLEELGTSWAKERSLAVAKACYLELGRKILEVELPEMRFCKHKVEQVYKAIIKHGFRGPRIDPLVARAAKRCAR